MRRLKYERRIETRGGRGREITAITQMEGPKVFTGAKSDAERKGKGRVFWFKGLTRVASGAGRLMKQIGWG
jgi:hypothetical protein